MLFLKDTPSESKAQKSNAQKQKQKSKAQKSNGQKASAQQQILATSGSNHPHDSEKERNFFASGFPGRGFSAPGFPAGNLYASAFSAWTKPPRSNRSVVASFAFYLRSWPSIPWRPRFLLQGPLVGFLPRSRSWSWGNHVLQQASSCGRNPTTIAFLVRRVFRRMKSILHTATI